MENILCTEIVSDIQNNFCIQHVLPMFCKKKSFWQRFTCNKLVFPKVTNLQSTFTSRYLELLASNSRHYPASIFPKDTGNNVMKDNSFIKPNSFNRSWRISKTPNTPKFFFIRSKLILGSNIVILNCLVKKNQSLNARKKSSVYYWKGRFVGISGLKTHLSLINWTFFSSHSNFDFSLWGNSVWRY